MLLNKETYTDENGVAKEKYTYGDENGEVTSVVDIPVGPEASVLTSGDDGSPT